MAVSVAVGRSGVIVRVGGLAVAVAGSMVAEGVISGCVGRIVGEDVGRLCEAGVHAERHARPASSARQAERKIPDPKNPRIG
jgi:hypothetical protein